MGYFLLPVKLPQPPGEPQTNGAVNSQVSAAGNYGSETLCRPTQSEHKEGTLRFFFLKSP